jgi:ankyrin repeat protein
MHPHRYLIVRFTQVSKMKVSGKEVNPIFAACETYDTTEADELIEAKADVNVTDDNGDSPLIIAARSCHCL